MRLARRDRCARLRFHRARTAARARTSSRRRSVRSPRPVVAARSGTAHTGSRRCRPSRPGTIAVRGIREVAAGRGRHRDRLRGCRRGREARGPATTINDATSVAPPSARNRTYVLVCPATISIPRIAELHGIADRVTRGKAASAALVVCERRHDDAGSCEGSVEPGVPAGEHATVTR